MSAGLLVAVLAAAAAFAPLPPVKPEVPQSARSVAVPTPRPAVLPPRKPAPESLTTQTPTTKAPTIEAPTTEAPATEMPTTGTPAERVLALATPAALPEPGEASVLCRDSRLAGEGLPDIVEVDAFACGIDEPVRVHAIDGIVLAPPMVAGCATARRFADWLTGTVRPGLRDELDGRVVKVQVMGSYVCRGRNGQPGARRSEHGRGRAVDVGGFTLADGRTITVKEGWSRADERTFLRSIWHKACGPFATVLGPDSDRHHHDHLHLDMSPRGGGPYCR